MDSVDERATPVATNAGLAVPGSMTITKTSPRKPTGAGGSRLRRFARSLGPTGYIAVAFLLLLVGIAVFAPLVAPYDPGYQDVRAALSGPSSAHWFGTDQLGRDIFSRIVYGSRPTLQIGLASSALAAVFGVAIGILGGFYSSWLDSAIMRLMDLLLGIPAILLAMTIIAIAGRSAVALISAIAIVGVPVYARLARAGTMQVRSLDYVKAARVSGAGDRYLMGRVILPNILGSLLVQVNVFTSVAILIEASLSFLGLGLPPPSPTWGGLLLDSKTYLTQVPTYGLFTGLTLTATILAIDTVARANRRYRRVAQTT
ncbi:ABC transporter permease [Amycolatopsis pithecellobii]|uniref:ABC transporter permease subunit n=1 Tax=Amycolatopsis pithecellobii TaxID=664692 RepID=A0A6N7ZB54_9PSEU|nr:ABC transporter permease [Amycolatopsis pithecellobii]MTD58994.1 ABC transporter permease subunit [Amycolatopsis pithecellobii]